MWKLTMRDWWLLAVLVAVWAFCMLMSTAFAEPVSRETTIIEALQQQRNQANDAVVACYADSRKQVADLQAKVLELEKAKPKDEVKQ